MDLSHVPSFVCEFAGWGLLGLALCTTVEKVLPIVPSCGMLILIGMLGVPEASALIWYLLGRWFGPERGEALVECAGCYVCLPVAQYRRLKSLYYRNRFWTTFTGQTIPVIRAYMAFPAGVLAFPLSSFTTATFLGALIWNTPFLSLGYVLRDSLLDPTAAALVAIVLPGSRW